MKDIETVMLRAKAALEARNMAELQESLKTKENDYESLVRDGIQKKFGATSKCPYDICDGSGIVSKPGSSDSWFCKCRPSLLMKNKLQFAQVPPEFVDLKVNDFQTEIYSSKEAQALAATAKNIAIAYVKNFAKSNGNCNCNGKGLYFYSNTKGSGKTRLMVSIGNALINTQGVGVRFIFTNTLLDEIKGTFEKSENGESYSALIAGLRSIEVLILDDMGAERPTPWVNEIFYGLLNDRMTAKKPTLFTSNCSIEDLSYNDRIVDRLFRMAMPVKFPEESVRRILAKQENEDFIKELLKG